MTYMVNLLYMGLCKITYKECCITLTCIYKIEADFSYSTDFCAKFSNDIDLRLLMVTIIKMQNF